MESLLAVNLRIKMAILANKLAYNQKRIKRKQQQLARIQHQILSHKIKEVKLAERQNFYTYLSHLNSDEERIRAIALRKTTKNSNEHNQKA